MKLITPSILPIIPYVDDSPRGRGRPVVAQLCSIFRDDSIWEMAEVIFLSIYHYSIQEAPQLGQFMVCYLRSLFRVSSTDELYGRVAHFHRLMKHHVPRPRMPSLRTLQSNIVWTNEAPLSYSRHALADQAKHQAWNVLELRIYDLLVIILPQFTL